MERPRVTFEMAAKVMVAEVTSCAVLVVVEGVVVAVVDAVARSASE